MQDTTKTNDHPALRNNLMPGSGSGSEYSAFDVMVRASETMFPVGGFESDAFHCLNSEIGRASCRERVCHRV